MNVHVNLNLNPMHTVLAHLRNGKTIEAIKEFRAAYGSGLKEAKDAIEAIRDTFMPNGAQPAEFLVLGRYENDYDWSACGGWDKNGAMAEANRLVNQRDETIVARVVARSVTTRVMKEVA
jgi:hypothetical protein